ncbi:MAG: NAD(P)-dependent oxidoreductase [Alphaproteobacteria bacterium]|nr:NAD(P)-dependent oxidoreductase [Alphaproteobacteria bacterium]
MTVGICGTGKMGAAMAERLMDKGENVAVWNRTAARADALVEAGATRCDTPRALADTCDTIIVMLINDDAVNSAYRDDDGLLSADLSGKLVVEMSTVLPGTTTALAEAVRGAGGAFIECPVGGTVPPARNGQLLGMAGGDTDDVERARPVLDKLCRRLDHVGPVGTGAAMKLAINLPLSVYWLALGEALAITEDAGIDSDLALDILCDSSGASKVAGLFQPGILQALGGDTPDGAVFEVSGAAKDIRLMTELASARGLKLPVIAETGKHYDAAIEDGWADRNFPLLAAWYAKQARP